MLQQPRAVTTATTPRAFARPAGLLKAATGLVAVAALVLTAAPAASAQEPQVGPLAFDAASYALDDLTGYVADAEPVYFVQVEQAPVSLSVADLGVDPAGPDLAAPAGTSEDRLADKPQPRVSGPTFTDCGFVPDVFGDGTFSRGASPVNCASNKRTLHAGTTLSRKRWYGFQFLDSDESTNTNDRQVVSISRWRCRGAGTYTYYVDANGDATDFQGNVFYGEGGDKARFNC